MIGEDLLNSLDILFINPKKFFPSNSKLPFNAQSASMVECVPLKSKTSSVSSIFKSILMG